MLGCNFREFNGTGFFINSAGGVGNLHTVGTVPQLHKTIINNTPRVIFSCNINWHLFHNGCTALINNLKLWYVFSYNLRRNFPLNFNYLLGLCSGFSNGCLVTLFIF